MQHLGEYMIKTYIACVILSTLLSVMLKVILPATDFATTQNDLLIGLLFIVLWMKIENEIRD